MDRHPIDVFNLSTKVCADCAHFSGTSNCAASTYVDKVTGASRPSDCFAERLHAGSCKPQAIKFLPSAAAQAAASVRRAQKYKVIEAALGDLRPDLVEAEELLQAWFHGVESRDENEDRIGKARRIYNELREALSEASGNVHEYAR